MAGDLGLILLAACALTSALVVAFFLLFRRLIASRAQAIEALLPGGARVERVEFAWRQRPKRSTWAYLGWLGAVLIAGPVGDVLLYVVDRSLPGGVWIAFVAELVALGLFMLWRPARRARLIARTDNDATWLLGVTTWWRPTETLGRAGGSGGWATGRGHLGIWGVVRGVIGEPIELQRRAFRNLVGDD